MRYGEAIEADLLKHYGVDLAAEWQSRRWRRLLNLIDRLPRNSFLAEAVAADEDAAQAWLDSGAQPGDRGERFSEWSPERDALERLGDTLQVAVQAIVASTGQKPPAFKPAPRPVTEVERLRERRRILAHRALVARLLPSTRSGG